MYTHNQLNASKGLCDVYTSCDIKFGMLQVRKNEISLRKCSDGSAQLCALEGTVVTRESARFDKNDTEPKSKLGYVPGRKLKIVKTYIVENILSFSQCQNENEYFSRGGNLQTTKWKNTKINCKTTGEIPHLTISKS